MPTPPKPATTRLVSPVLREELAEAILERLQALNLKQTEAAKLLGIAQPRLNLLVRGHGASFSLDTLANLAVRLGLSVRLQITRPYRR
jgi:predicted XRE-type DNA-binding protein